MGLQLVEYVMEIEDEFGIRIPDDCAERLTNVGKVAEYVASKLRERGQTVDIEIVRQKVTEILIEVTDIDPREVHDEANFISDLGIDATDDIVADVKRRRRQRPLDDVL